MMMIGDGYAGDRWWFGGPITLILARFWRSGGQVTVYGQVMGILVVWNVENNFWKNISARDAFPFVEC